MRTTGAETLFIPGRFTRCWRAALLRGRRLPRNSVRDDLCGSRALLGLSGSETRTHTSNTKSNITKSESPL